MISDIIAGIIIASGVYFIVALIATMLFIFGVFDDLKEKIQNKCKRKKNDSKRKNANNGQGSNGKASG